MEDMTKAMTSESAKCQMSWNTPGDNLTMFCWWKGTDPDAINKQLESMNDSMNLINLLSVQMMS